MKDILHTVVRTGSYSKPDIATAALAAAIGIALLLSYVASPGTFIGLFGVLALILRANSKISFLAALVCLVNIPILQLIGQDSLMHDFILYAFYFLFIGATGAVLEYQKPATQHTPIHASERPQHQHIRRPHGQPPHQQQPSPLRHKQQRDAHTPAVHKPAQPSPVSDFVHTPRSHPKVRVLRDVRTADKPPQPQRPRQPGRSRTIDIIK